MQKNKAPWRRQREEEKQDEENSRHIKRALDGLNIKKY